MCVETGVYQDWVIGHKCDEYYLDKTESIDVLYWTASQGGDQNHMPKLSLYERW